MAPYRLARTPGFEKSVSKLSSELKKLLAKQLTLLECDPKHPSLYTKKNITASRSLKTQIFESRINSSHRFLWLYDEKEQSIIVLLIAGDHRVVERK